MSYFDFKVKNNPKNLKTLMVTYCEGLACCLCTMQTSQAVNSINGGVLVCTDHHLLFIFVLLLRHTRIVKGGLN